MQVTTLSVFRFQGFWDAFWAFRQMGLAPRALRRMPELTWCKVLGSGRGAGFDLAPNLAVYAILATWPSREVAERAVREAPVYGRWRDRSVEDWTVFMEATRAHGTWGGAAPFEAEARGDAPRPVGVLTRAQIRFARLLPFWRSVPAVSDATVGRVNLRFGIGIGEWPLWELATFSIWDSDEAIQEFAYRAGRHRETMALAKRDRWFAEDLFARFRVLGSEGRWADGDPLAALSEPRP
jgi:spheroidene monooxygenase